MKFEHKLSPIVAGFAQQTAQQLQEFRTRYLAALGAAKEIEMETATVRRVLETQLEIVRINEKLPESRTPYALNSDGTALIGEIADPQPEPPPAPEIAPPVKVIKPNGGAEKHG